MYWLCLLNLSLDAEQVGELLAPAQTSPLAATVHYCYLSKAWACWGGKVKPFAFRNSCGDISYQVCHQASAMLTLSTPDLPAGKSEIKSKARKTSMTQEVWCLSPCPSDGHCALQQSSLQKNVFFLRIDLHYLNPLNYSPCPGPTMRCLAWH